MAEISLSVVVELVVLIVTSAFDPNLRFRSPVSQGNSHIDNETEVNEIDTEKKEIQTEKNESGAEKQDNEKLETVPGSYMQNNR
jgi:hypothetical protein